MRIINEALNEELFQKCKEELKSKFKERCWSSSLVTWQPQLKQGISGSCMVANVSDELGELIHEEIRPYLPEHETIRCNFHLCNLYLVLQNIMMVIEILVQPYT